MGSNPTPSARAKSILRHVALFLLHFRAFFLTSLSSAIYRQLRQASHFVYMMCIAASGNVYIAQSAMCIRSGRADAYRYGHKKSEGGR